MKINTFYKNPIDKIVSEKISIVGIFCNNRIGKFSLSMTLLFNDGVFVSDDMLLQESLMEILPAVSEANSISEELDKKKKFEAMVVSPEARGVLKGKTEV